MLALLLPVERMLPMGEHKARDAQHEREACVARARTTRTAALSSQYEAAGREGSPRWQAGKREIAGCGTARARGVRGVQGG